MSTNPRVKIPSKINTHWLLSANGFPFNKKAFDDGWCYTNRRLASKVTMDSVSILHEPKDERFRPIILSGTTLRTGKVKSEGKYTALNFYETLCHWVALIDELNRKADEETRLTLSDSYPTWDIFMDDHSTIDWGCRTFTVLQLRQLKKLMEWHYREDRQTLKAVRKAVFMERSKN